MLSSSPSLGDAGAVGLRADRGARVRSIGNATTLPTGRLRLRLRRVLMEPDPVNESLIEIVADIAKRVEPEVLEPPGRKPGSIGGKFDDLLLAILGPAFRQVPDFADEPERDVGAPRCEG